MISADDASYACGLGSFCVHRPARICAGIRLGFVCFRIFLLQEQRLKFFGANATVLTILCAFVYAAVCFGLLVQALAGKPLLAAQ